MSLKELSLKESPRVSLKEPSKEYWQLIPMRDFPHLTVLREKDGNVIATVSNEYAETFQALPELLSASQEIFEHLKSQHKQWGKESSLGRLQRAIAKIKKNELSEDSEISEISSFSELSQLARLSDND